MDNAHHKYKDASNSWSEIDWHKATTSPTLSVDISPHRLHRLNVISDRYDYVMKQVGKCRRLGFAPQCTCEAECVLVQMHNKWKFEQ